MLALLLAPFVLQAAAMAVDEGVCHRRRRLPRWERVGHPLDTLTTVACFGWLVLAEPSRSAALVYVGLAAFSSLFVTKDEPVHAKRCTPGEHWLHAVLFVLHPIVLACAGLLWWTGRLRGLLVAELALTASFGVYQTLYWNGPWQKRRRRLAR